MESSSIIAQQVAAIALQQIQASVPQSVYWSWGVTNLMYTNYKGMPTLGLRVNGLIHKGWVYVSLDEASDTYTIFLLNCKYSEKKKVTEIYCDMLGSTIDSLIEKPAEMSERRYKRLVENETKRILNINTKRR